MPRGHTISALSLVKTREKRQVRHNMTQMASVLAVATVFIRLWTLISTFDSLRRGGLIHETKIPMQELETKV